MRPQDELKATPIVLAGIIGSILVFAMIVGLSALFLREKEQVSYDRQSAGPAPELIRSRSEQIEKLSEYRWIDEDKGVLRIPIERAMKLFVDDYAKKGPGK